MSSYVTQAAGLGDIANGIKSIGENIGNFFNTFAHLPSVMTAGLVQGIEGQWSTISNQSDYVKNFVTMDSSCYSGIRAYSENAYNLFAAFGFALMLLFWVIALADKLTKDRLNGYELLRSGIELMFGCLLMMEGYKILEAIIDMGDEFASSISGLGVLVNTNNDGSKAGTYSTAYKVFLGVDNAWTSDTHTWQNLNTSVTFINALGGFIESFIMTIFGWVTCGLAISICFGRVIQIAAYMALAPLSMADAFNGGIANSSAIRFLKKFLALCLQVVVILIILILTKHLFIGETNIVFLIATQLISVSLIMKSQQITSDIVGA